MELIETGANLSSLFFSRKRKKSGGSSRETERGKGPMYTKSAKYRNTKTLKRTGTQRTY